MVSTKYFLANNPILQLALFRLNTDVVFYLRILVRMDDELIRNYSHESAFLLEINHHHASEVPDVVLVEICQ